MVDLSGEFRLRCRPDQVRFQFYEAEQFKRCLPDCRAIKENGPGIYLVTVKHASDPSKVVQYHFRMLPGEDENHFTMSCKGATPETLIVTSYNRIALKKDGDLTVFSYESKLRLNDERQNKMVDPQKAFALFTSIFERVADNIQKEGDAMTDQNPEFEKALNEAEDAVIELEHEAEEAAASGVLGGAQMWGWFAVALLILILLIFFR